MDWRRYSTRNPTRSPGPARWAPRRRSSRDLLSPGEVSAQENVGAAFRLSEQLTDRRIWRNIERHRAREAHGGETLPISETRPSRTNVRPGSTCFFNTASPSSPRPPANCGRTTDAGIPARKSRRLMSGTRTRSYWSRSFGARIVDFVTLTSRTPHRSNTRCVRPSSKAPQWRPTSRRAVTPLAQNGAQVGPVPGRETIARRSPSQCADDCSGVGPQP